MPHTKKPGPPWRDVLKITARPDKPGLGQGLGQGSWTMPPKEKPGPPWRDRRWRMPQSEKPGLGQGSATASTFLLWWERVRAPLKAEGLGVAAASHKIAGLFY